MKEILEKLKQKEIISAKNVSDLRRYISTKYPNLSSHESSILLVNTIHKIIDNNLLQFDSECRDKIRQSIISKSVHKSTFNITADEVLYAFVDNYIEEENYIDNMVSWVNENQAIEITRNQLLGVIDEIKKLDTEYLAKAIQLEPEEIMLYNEVIEEPANMQMPKRTVNKYLGMAICGFLLALFTLTVFIKSNKPEEVDIATADEIIEIEEVRDINELPREFKYKDIEVGKLREWLNNRDSRLADEPYLTAIISVAYEFDINPILLIAITGQEQGFVPRTHPYADKMANNPFNVYGSWIDYNTEISDSARIAAITIVNLSKNRPDDVDPIQWINRKYAEDENWHKGVSRIFHMLSEELSLVEQYLNEEAKSKDLLGIYIY